MSTESNPPDRGQSRNPTNTDGSAEPSDTVDDENDSHEQIAADYKRVGSVEPTDAIRAAITELEDQFLLDNPADTVGGTLTDDARTRACLQEAISYFHENLPQDIRAHINEKWGIADSMIDTRQIGFVDDSNDVTEHLREEGFSPLTISRAGLGTEPTIKHLFECSGVSSENAELVPESRRDDEVASESDCSHSVPEPIEMLVRGQLQGLVQPEEIDLEAVAGYLEANGGMNIWNWWDNRITFPYRDEDGEFCYLILRATDGTDDIIYNNGITDRTDAKSTPVSETVLGQQIIDSTSQNDDGDQTVFDRAADVLDEYLVLPHKETIYNAPDEEGNEEPADEAIRTIGEHAEGLVDSPKELLSHGLMHGPEAAAALEESETALVHLIDVSDNPDYDSEFLLTPPALGIEPGANIEFVNHTDVEASMSVAGTPDGVWWDDGTFRGMDPLSCDESGMYRYEVNVAGTRFNGIVVCYDDVYTNRRNYQVEQWVGDEPGFEVDLAKYIKQTIDRAWINSDAIVEPIFGCETVHEDSPLLVTEGVTDAIVAHQHNLPCVAPATTNFKEHHYDLICDLAEDVSTVFVVNDNEVNNAGIHGALRTAKVIENDGHTVRIGELPRPPNQDKIDVAEYLQHHSQDQFINDVLQDSIVAEEHDLFSPERHDPAFHQSQATSDGDYEPDTDGGSDWDEEDFDASNASALYSLTLADVIDFDSLDMGSRSGKTIYRGTNPIQHRGNSVGYFVIRDHGEFITAKDYKFESSGDGYYYNPLTWLASAAECDCPPQTDCSCTRPATRPMGSLSNSEVWWAWHYAKKANHIDFPDDDKVPSKAIWFLAEHHDVLPAEAIPNSFEDNKELPASKYNEVLRIVDEEYGLNPGRRSVSTNDE